MNYNKIHINPISPEPTTGSVLVIYTGAPWGWCMKEKEISWYRSIFSRSLKKYLKSAGLTLTLHSLAGRTDRFFQYESRNLDPTRGYHRNPL
jgi:hypothetical protein